MSTPKSPRKPSDKSEKSDSTSPESKAKNLRKEKTSSEVDTDSEAQQSNSSKRKNESKKDKEKETESDDSKSPRTKTKTNGNAEKKDSKKKPGKLSEEPEDEFNLSDILKDLLETKECTTCQSVIPQNSVTCFSCHSIQPVNFLAVDSKDYMPYKSGKGFTIKRQFVYDDEDPNRGVVWKNVIFKVNVNPGQYFLQGGGVTVSMKQQKKKIKGLKKDPKVFADGHQVVMALPRLQQVATGYVGQNGADVVNALIDQIVLIREDMLQDAKKLVATGDIVFEALWYLFERGTPVYYTDRESGCIFGTIIKNWEYSAGLSPSFRITGTIIKSDGNMFFEQSISTAIPAFDGVVKIRHLSIQKLTKSVYEALNTRGKVFADVALGAHFKQYTGTLLTPSFFGYMKFRATGRIMLDISTFNRMNPNNKKFVGPDENTLLQQQQNRQRQQQQLALGYYNHGGADYSTIVDESEFKKLKESQYWMTYPMIPGFSFPLKKWGEFVIECVSDIVFDDYSFVQLVLPEDKKRTIRALVEEHQNSGGVRIIDSKINPTGDKKKQAKTAEIIKESEKKLKEKDSDINGIRRQPDLIKNKGGGCIFLLHGPPGVGKTLTAEAVSEHLHIPLYQVTVGELGTEPEALEKSLGNLLELAALWNASILLDEADIFLERRSRNDILRNAMVGIFLRLLEYHQGVLFLTTNRVDCLDEAFSSRISVALYYPSLEKPARAEVWKNFLIDTIPDKGDKDKLSDKSAPKTKKSSQNLTKITFNFDQLAEYELNGRQIRSCVRMARALANADKALLTQEHLLQTIQLSLDFTKQFGTEKNLDEESVSDDEDRIKKKNNRLAMSSKGKKATGGNGDM